MATIEYLHVCDYAFPAEGGKPCIIGIFDVINAPAFPVMHPHMAIALRLRGTAHEVLPLKIELGRPNGDVLNTMQATLTVGPDGSAFINVNMINTQFTEAGRYTVRVSSAGQNLISHSLHVLKTQAPPQALPQGGPQKLH
jgi:hypothetical protein